MSIRVFIVSNGGIATDPHKDDLAMVVKMDKSLVHTLDQWESSVKGVHHMESSGSQSVLKSFLSGGPR